MNRSSFLRSLATVIVAPKVLMEVDLTIPKVPIGDSVDLFTQLNLLVPEWKMQRIKKYGSESYMSSMEILGKSTELP